jgi:tetratricopeptide (TPR) repeat protein
MTSDKRRAKLERDLKSLEANFAEELLSALRICAAGHWGLLGRNGERWDDGRSLVGLGDEISALRKELGYTEGFGLYERFVAYRRRRGPNDPGEPKLAQAFLAGLCDESRSSISGPGHECAIMEQRVTSLRYEERLALYMEAQELFNAGRYAEAEPILAAFAREEPCFEHGTVWYELADIFEQKGQLEAADSAYLSALGCEWNDIYAIGYGVFLWRVARKENALATLRDLKQRIHAGAVAPTFSQSVDSMIDAIEKQMSYEAYWSKQPW